MSKETAATKKPAPPAAAPAPVKAGAAKPAKGMSPETRAKLEQISGGLDLLQEDTSVPRNIRRGADEAKKILWNEALALDVRKASAIGILDELANDPNIPLHGRTLIWSIMSQLEPLA